MSHKTRLLLFTTLLVLGVFAVSSLSIYKISRDKLETLQSSHLSQIRTQKISELQKDFEGLRNTLLLISEVPSLKGFVQSSSRFQKEILNKPMASADAARDFLKNYYEGKGHSDISRALDQLSPFALYVQSEFLRDSLNRKILPEDLSTPPRKNYYYESYKNTYLLLKDIADRNIADDILLVDPTGTVLFSLDKSLSLGDNLTSGPFSNSRIAQAFRWTVSASANDSRFFDFAPLSQFLYKQAGFFAAPLYSKQKYIGSLLLQIPASHIDSILSNHQNWESLGLGKSGEVVAFGSEGFLRTNSRLLSENEDHFFKLFQKYIPSLAILDSIRRNETTALSISLSPPQLSRYLLGRPVFTISNDYLGIPSLLSAEKFHLIDNVEWIMVAKISEAEGLDAVPVNWTILAITAGILIFGCILFSLMFYRRVLAPMASLANALEQIKNKNFPESFKSDGSEEFREVTAVVNQLINDYAQVSESQSFLENVVHSLNEAFFMVEVLPATPPQTESRFLILMVNPSAERLLGAKNEELKGNELKKWLSFDVHKSIFTDAQPLSLEPTKRFFSAFLLSKKQVRIPLEVTWSRVDTKSHRLILAFICNDITWKKSIEGELHLQEQVLKESQSLSKTGSFRWDIKTGNCIWSEEEFLLFGFTPNEFSPTYSFFRTLIVPEDLPLFDEAISEAHRNIKPFQVDLRFRRKDRPEIVWFRCQGKTEYDDYGNALYMYITTQDITKLRSAEQSLIATKNEALKASQAKSDFLAQMSHEIRTPMNAIMGMAELLKETKLDNDQQYYVRIFVKAGEVLMALINDILDLSKIEAGQVSIENIPFDMQRMLTDVTAMVQTRVDEKNLKFTFEMSAKVNPYLMGDPTKLQQVLINLASNAIKFTEQGSVHISVTKDRSRKDCLLISVKDSGVGIAKDKQHLIFQKFSQADSSITRKYGGTGLGLAISKSLIELMGGSIWFKSKEGEGTTFFVNLPYREQVVNPSTQEPLKMAAPDLDFATLRLRDSKKKIRILLADDTEDNRTLFIHFLKSGPFEIIEAENGLQALSKIKSDEFDIVFMDVQMPQLDGYAATQAIRKWEEDEHRSPLPIIALTAHALAEDRQKSIQAGCNAHIAKPFKKDTLLGVINRYSL